MAILVDVAMLDGIARMFASSGDMPTNNWKENSNGQNYVERIRAEGRSDVLDWARAVLAPGVQKVFDDYSKKYDWGNPGEIKFSRGRVGQDEASGGRSGGGVDGTGGRENETSASEEGRPGSVSVAAEH